MRSPASLPLKSSAFPLALVVATLWMVMAPAPALAGTIVPCNGQCTWSVRVDGASVASGEYQINGETGDITLANPVWVNLAGGGFVGVNSLSGNSDPILGFSVSAGTGASGGTFAFSFSLPVALSGAINASSSISYSLTSLSSAGAQIAPLFGGNVLTAQEVDTTVGGLAPLDKGVNTGAAFFFAGGPLTQNSPVYTAASSITGNLAYDLMGATVAFSLSPNSQVGASGFVQQVPVPLPAAAWLLVGGFAGLGGLVRRRPIAA